MGRFEHTCPVCFRVIADRTRRRSPNFKRHLRTCLDAKRREYAERLVRHPWRRARETAATGSGD